MTEEHRRKIKVSCLINRLEKVASGEIEGATVSDTVRAAEILLRKAMPDLSAQELSGGIANYVARLPQPAKTVDDWQASVRPVEGHTAPLLPSPVPEGTKH